MPVKRQGFLDTFNGIDVIQTRHYMKIDCHTYISKFCEKYLDSWLGKVLLTANKPTPLPTVPTWLKKFNATTSPTNLYDQAKLAKAMQIKYRAGVGKLIWAMTTCRPDIAFTSVKLSQSNSAPAEHHYHGLKHAIHYLYTRLTESTFGGPVLALTSLKVLCHLSIATTKIFSLTIVLIMTPQSRWRTVIWTGLRVSKRDDRSAESASNSLVVRLYTKLSFN
jgi:hypothetical protein